MLWLGNKYVPIQRVASTRCVISHTSFVVYDLTLFITKRLLIHTIIVTISWEWERLIPFVAAVCFVEIRLKYEFAACNLYNREISSLFKMVNHYKNKKMWPVSESFIYPTQTSIVVGVNNQKSPYLSAHTIWIWIEVDRAILCVLEPFLSFSSYCLYFVEKKLFHK